jgi:hypothetical protein
MATSLLSACGISDSIKFIFVKENSDIDASFLISSLIGQRIKQINSGVVLICAHQTLKYYTLNGMKLGYNLSMAITKNNVKVVEPMNETFKNNLDDYSLSTLQDQLNEYLEELLRDNKSQITIILDNLQYFHNNVTDDKVLINFAHILSKLTRKHKNLSVILKMNLSDLFETVTNIIEDLADLSLNVEPLKSGNFKDVDGKILVKKFSNPSENSWDPVESESNILYKINDRNIKVFAPGEFGLKV